MPYVELHCHSHYSLLDGASSPEALLDRAAELGYTALALTDHDGLYGVVPFYLAARERGIKPIIGAEVTLDDGSHLTLLARDRSGYANLCGLLSHGGLAGSKRHPLLGWEALASRAAGLIALSGCERGALSRLLMEGRHDEARELAGRCREVFHGRYYIELQRHRLPEDARRDYYLVRLAKRLRVPTVVTHNVHYATRERHRLHDVLTAIAQRTTLDRARLRPNSEYYLPAPAEVETWHRAHPEAIAATAEIAEQCEVDLDFAGERLPEFPVPPGETAFSYLYQLCHEGLRRKYQPVTPEAARQLQHELEVIQQAGLAGYFLIVWDIVRFAREQGILARGRGSAANSIVAYVLDITAVDPIAHNLLFERFLTPGSRTMPDIDIDFAADRREEVIQYVYRTYGEERTGMVATTITYHARSAVRDVGKVLGLPLDVVDQVAKMVPVAGDVASAVQRVAGEAAAIGPWPLLVELCRQIEGTPRHLGIHCGGMILTGAPLSEIVPLERATMPGRVVVQWDKYAVEDAGLIKFDLLGLRALAVVDEVVRTVRERRGIEINLDALPLDDPAIYDTLCRGDTVGAFQVESRAQAQMLPNLAPRRFEDIVVAVALIRPGPLQGNMVHPYLRRRRGQEAVTYFHPGVEPILSETLGVILFQEQVLRVAMAVAGFSGAEADGLRRAMSRQRSPEEMERWRARFIAGAMERGLLESEATEIFAKLAGFAGYGFCKSHAAAFAQTAYHTLYLRHYYPAEYYCGLLNARPGYWGPDVIVGDARRHGVRILPVDINLSRAKCRVEGEGAVRLGLEYVLGLGEAALKRLEQAQAAGPFRSLEDLYRRTRLSREQMEALVRAGALDCLGQPRRQLLWGLGRLRPAEGELEIEIPEGRASFPELSLEERVAADYELLGLPAHEHVMVLFRDALAGEGVCPSADLPWRPSGERVRVAGVGAIRQQPPSAKGFVFLTLEDEEGLINIIVRPDVFARYRELIKTAAFMIVDGHIECEHGVVNVIAHRFRPLTRGGARG